MGGDTPPAHTHTHFTLDIDQKHFLIIRHSQKSYKVCSICEVELGKKRRFEAA